MYKKRDGLTVAEAAARLRVKEQAVRKRIQRGTIAHDKDDDGRVYVYLDTEDEGTATGNSTDADTSINTLVQSLQDQIVYIRQEAEDWKEEARRKDTIIMSLTQRISELEASSEPRGAPETASETTEGTDALLDHGAREIAASPPQEQRSPSWWCTFFGFDRGGSTG